MGAVTVRMEELTTAKHDLIVVAGPVWKADFIRDGRKRNDS